MDRDEQDLILLEYTNWETASGPKTDDELHEWISDNLGMNIPRQRVCENHCAPFEFLADIYFERTLSAIAMANRGGAKTAMAALWIHLCSRFKAGCESASVATEEQVKRAYSHLKSYLRIDQANTGDNVADEPQTRSVKYHNDSLYELIIATMQGTSGPHPQKVHTDEADHMDPKVFENSRNMAQGKPGRKAQSIITSTRYRATGLMQKLWDDCDAAEKAGFRPPYKRYQWCIFETAQNVPNCMVANPDLPPEQQCGCDKIVKGEWESEEPRRFSDVCQGRLARSDGWIELDDVWGKFQETDRVTWETQIECIKPSMEGAVFPNYSTERVGVKGFKPDPANGPTFGSVDFGGTNPHAVVFIQWLRKPVQAISFQGEEIWLPEGSRVVFDEIYKAEIAPSVLCDLVLKRVNYWKGLYPEFRILKFFYDVQAKGARLEWAHHKPPIVLVNYVTKDVQLHISYWADLMEDRKFWIDVGRVNMLPQEIESWHYPDQKQAFVDSPDQPVKDFDHSVDATRYGIANIRAIERRGGVAQGATGSGGGHGTPSASQTGSGAGKYLPRTPGDQVGQSVPLPRPPGWPGS